MTPDEIVEQYIPEPLRPYVRAPLFDLAELAAYAKRNPVAIPALLEQRAAYWTRRAAEEDAEPALPSLTPPRARTVIPIEVYEACARQSWKAREKGHAR